MVLHFTNCNLFVSSNEPPLRICDRIMHKTLTLEISLKKTVVFVMIMLSAVKVLLSVESR